MSAERRRLRFDDWDDVLAEVEALRASGYERAGWGTMSLGQIGVHLSLVMNACIDGFPWLLPWPLRMICRALFLKKILRHEPLSLRGKAPKEFLPPDRLEDDKGIERLEAAVERFRNHPGEFAPHPALGRLTREQMKHQQLWHAEHHLGLLGPKPEPRP